jgi:hypothetical protein
MYSPMVEFLPPPSEQNHLHQSEARLHLRPERSQPV